MDERENELGFKPQKELRYNNLLPYRDLIDQDANKALQDIKTHLPKAVLYRDIRFGVLQWTSQLVKYTRLYGMRFSKEDHVMFVKLLFELITMPDFEATLVNRLVSALLILLKKRELLSRDDLILPWRPLYDLFESVLNSKHEHYGLKLLSTSIENQLKSLVRVCRAYFSVESTQEMLDQWRPLLCPFDVSMAKGCAYFELFLPTLLPPKEHHRGFKLWLDEFLELWDTCHNGSQWEVHLGVLLTRLANHNIGYIDWTPYIPKIYNRFLRGLELPVGRMLRGPGRVFDITVYCLWLVAIMGGSSGSIAREHMSKLFKAIETFFHPSNTGQWTIMLNHLLIQLPLNFNKRVHRERYKKPCWETPVPDSYKLTDDDITEFVKGMTNIVTIAMFGKTECITSSKAIQCMSLLRPEITIPAILERLYPAMETLTEPHRLTSCMICISSAARPMLEGSKYYPQGRTHLLPILNLCLPGIDSNDFKKSMVTFQLIASFASLVPFVDCSLATQHRSDLTEIEKEICSSTSQFEDFILLMFDRIFALVENSARDHSSRMDSAIPERLNPQESMLEVALAATVSSVLQQCSQSIYHSALQKIYRYATSNVFEIKVAGKYVANIVRAAAKTKPEKALKLFVPTFVEKIRMLTANAEIQNEEDVDDELLWYLLLLSEVVKSNGEALLAYKDQLKEVLSATLYLKCKEASRLSKDMLKNILKNLLTFYVKDFLSVQTDIDQPLSEYLAIRDWAKAGDLDTLNVGWHISSQQEIAFGRELLEIYLKDQLTSLQRHIDGEKTLTRDELFARLNIIVACLEGSAFKLPQLQGEQINLIDRDFCLSPKPQHAHVCDFPNQGISFDGQNVRNMVATVLQRLLEHVLQTSEDDIKSLKQIIQIYNNLISFRGLAKDEFTRKWKNFQAVKKSMANTLVGKNKHIRALLIDRAQIQHENRTLYSGNKVFTDIHKKMLDDLLKLSVSTYRGVRQTAQAVLQISFSAFTYSYKLFLPDILKFLKNDPDTSHYQFKGSLYVLSGQLKNCLALKADWWTLSEVWPALCEASHSEKPSIMKAMDGLADRVHAIYETLEITVNVSESSKKLAEKFLESTTEPKVSAGPLTVAELENAVKIETKRQENNLSLYHHLVERLTKLAGDKDLYWKFREMSLEFIGLQIRQDVKLPVNTINLFLKSLIHDTLAVRKLALSAVTAILKQQRRPFKKITVDPYKIANVAPPGEEMPLLPGNRADNDWVLYDSDNRIDSEEKWNAATFVEKTHWGFYSWPKKLEVYAASVDQPSLGHHNTEIYEDYEKQFYEHFTNEEYVKKLIDFLSLEEHKGHDRFQSKNYMLFKALFKNFGDTFLSVIKPHVERLVDDTSHETHDSSQRCAAEIIAGLIRGAKLWTYQKYTAMWEWLVPVIRKVTCSMTVETIADWGVCFSTASESQDPRKMYPMLELLLDSPLNGQGGSFGDSSRLFILQGAFSQQEWRIPDVLHRLLQYLQPHLSHSYKNVRDRIGSVLTSIFLYDYKVIKSGSPFKCPSRSPFIDLILPQLEILRDAKLADISTQTNGASNKDVSMEDNAEREGEDEEEESHKTAIKLCKTVMKWLQTNCARMHFVLPSNLFKLIPIIAPLTSITKDIDLTRDARVTLVVMSQAYIDPQVVPLVISTIKEVVELSSWHARTSILNYIQVMVFYNLFSFQPDEYKEEIKDIVLHLLCDDQLEVRELAAQTLSGFLHCGYLEMNQKLLNHFEMLSSTKIKKRKRLTDAFNPASLLKRHAGVLGLSAFVQASPYDVSEFMPRILMDLSYHLEDPQPIQMTVKKTLSDFRRTHHDNWQDHKQKFTDDQLVVLTDLLVSPNYYA